MASSASAASRRPVTRPTPRGANVRAFIESVERGSKPKPDFFNSEPAVLDQTAQSKATKVTKRSINKPPVLSKKPSLTGSYSKGRAQTSLVISSSSCRKTPVPLPDAAVGASHGEEELVSSNDINCHSEDSGNSTCDLKYSGSLSSNQSSSHDPTYQLLSEPDDGFSERTSSSCYDTTGSTTNEVPQYSEPSEVTVSAEDSKHSASTINYRKNSKHHSAYKYHVPSKLGGTLPRDRKKASVIGKAVAKGRNTLKKKTSSTTTEDNSSNTATLLDGAVKSMTDSLDRSDYDFTDSEFDTDFSDSEWETDGEQNAVEHSDNQAASCSRLTSPSEHEYATLPGDSESVTSRQQSTEGCAEPKSKSKFYNVEDTGEDNLVNLMRQHSSKKEKKARLKKRLKHIKGNILELKQKTTVQKLVKSSNDKFAAVKTFIGKFKKTATLSKSDVGDSTADSVSGKCANSDVRDTKAARRVSSLSLEEQHDSGSDSHSDRHSDRLSVSSQNSWKMPTDSSTASASGKLGLSLSSSRTRTQSLGTVVQPPPLPPRATARSQHIPETTELGYLPPPPPPPRTTSKADLDGASSLAQSPEVPLERQSSQGSNRSSSYAPKFAKAKPTASPRSPKISLPSMNAVETSRLSHKISLPACSSTPHRLSGADIFLLKTHSVPALYGSTPSPDSSVISSPRIPTRKESSKSLLSMSNADDESIRRRDEILNSAAKSTVERQDSGEKTTQIDEGQDSPGSPVAMLRVPSSSSTTAVLTESASRVCSEFIEDEPLYQEYREIKRQSVNKTSTLMRGRQPNISLWSTTPAVLTSGVLDHMNAEEIKLQEAMFEVVTSEASYLRSINMLNTVFISSPQFCDEEILPPRDKRALFSNIAAVQEVSSRLFVELECHWKSDVILTAICEIISTYAHTDLDVYVKYCSNQSFQDRTLKKLISQNTRFQEALAELEKSSECHGLSMSSFLLLPMQRITRLPLLLDAILRRQEVWSDQYRNAQLCYEQVKKVVKRCNDGALKMEQTEQVLSIENKLSFNKLKKIPLTSASRQLIKQGDLVYLSVDGGRSAVNLLSVKPKNLSLFLFNDLLLVTKKKGEGYAVVDYASRVNVETEEWSAERLAEPRLNAMAQKCQAKFLFMLVLLQNHQKKHSEFMLSCHTETERTRWTEAFTAQVQGDCDDKIYESWDCPQAVAIHDYTAKQPDELSLETGDVLNVLRKTADGWYEGERVSDGRTGWLPSSYTTELQNEHVRARHLKERYKLLRAAAKLMK